MPKNFLANPPATDTATATVPVASTTRSRTRQNPADKFSLSGEEHLHILYCLGFASVSEWSPLQQAQKPGEVMSILMPYLRLK